MIHAAVIATLLALAGCGGTTAPTAKPATAGTHPDAAPPAHAGGNPHDALIGAADLSTTWTAQTPTATGLTCGDWDPLRDAAKQLESPRFNRESVDIQQTLAVFADAEGGDIAYRRLNSGATQRCMRRALRRRMRFSSGGGIAFVSPVTVVRIERLGKHSHGIRYTAGVNAELGRRDAYIVTINSHVGSAAASVTIVTGASSSLAEEAYDQLAASQEKHLEAIYG